MLDLKMITQDTTTWTASNWRQESQAVHTDSYAVDMISNQVDEIVARIAHCDGYKIYATIDLDLEKRAAVAREHLPPRAAPRLCAPDMEDYALSAPASRGRGRERPLRPSTPGSVVVLIIRRGHPGDCGGGLQPKPVQPGDLLRRPLGTAFTPLFRGCVEKGFPGTLVRTRMDNRQMMRV